MSSILRFGVDRQVEFDLPPETMVADWSTVGLDALDDPARATAAALRSPLDLPPVAQALTPDDHVVLAVDSETPQAPLVTAGAIHALREGGATPERIAVVLSHARNGSHEFESPFLADKALADVAVEIHDPDDTDGLCYLATTDEQHPVYLNRRIVEADFVLPIGPLRLPSSFGYFGAWGGLFPAFADVATHKRYQSPLALRRAHSGSLAHEAQEAAWLLGVQFVVQVVPGPDDRVSEVFAGSSGAVLERGQRLCDRLWRRPLPRRAGLVVAAISGGPEQQTWENFGRALYAASQAVAEDGAIALCTQLSRAPGPALRRLSGLEDLSVKQHAVEKQATFDAQSAALLAELLEKKRIYLLSELDAETVEDLGVAHVECEDEIARLSRHHESCILLADAQYAMPVE
jgi:nickel-dependent lactate racemase